MPKIIKYIAVVILTNFTYFYVVAQNNYNDSLLVKSVNETNYKETLLKIRQIRESGDITYLQSLKEIQLVKQSGNDAPFVKKIDSLAIISIELKATILQLELNQIGLNNEEEKANFIINLIRDKILFKPGSTINPEIIVLKENLTSFTPYLLEAFDNDTSVSMKLIYLSVLENSKNNNLENEVLIRIDKNKNHPQVFYKMLFILGRNGGNDSYEYYLRKVKPDNTIPQGIKDNFMKIMNESTKDINLKTKTELVNKKEVSNVSTQRKNTIEEKKVVNSVNSSSKNIIHPEDIGEDFSLYEKDTLLYLASTSNDNIILRKTAKSLGDKYISNELKLTNTEKETINRFTEKYLNLINDADPNIREECRLQIERLWQLAAPTLVKQLSSDDIAKVELASKSLILMRNEEIITSIINQANTTSDHNKRNRYISILSRMQEQRTSLITGRICLGPDESAKIYTEMVLPAIADLKK